MNPLRLLGDLCAALFCTGPVFADGLCARCYRLEQAGGRVEREAKAA